MSETDALFAYHRRKHCAPLERRSGFVTGVYKHLAPLEPEPLLGCDVSSAAPTKNSSIRTPYNHAHVRRESLFLVCFSELRLLKGRTNQGFAQECDQYADVGQQIRIRDVGILYFSAIEARNISVGTSQRDFFLQSHKSIKLY